MWKEQFQTQAFKLEHSTASDFSVYMWRKQRNVTRNWVIYRFIICVCYFLTLICVLYFWMANDHKIKRERELFLIFASNWSHILQFIVFFLALTVTSIDYSREKNEQSEPEEKIGPLKKTLWYLYTMALPCSIIICIGFWAAVYKQGQKITATTMILHLVNGVIHIVDFHLVAIPYRLYHFYMPWTLALVYLMFSAIYEVSGGTGMKDQIPIYTVLDWKYHPGRTACYAVGFLAALTVVHAVLFLVYIGKLKWRRKSFGE